MSERRWVIEQVVTWVFWCLGSIDKECASDGKVVLERNYFCFYLKVIDVGELDTACDDSECFVLY